MNKSQRFIITAAAMAGLYTGALAVRTYGQDSAPSAASSAGSSDSKTASDKHGCKGQNSCKGKGGCGSAAMKDAPATQPSGGM